MGRSAVGVVTVLAVIGLVAAGCADPEAPGPPVGAGPDPEAAADGVVPLAKA